MADSNYTIEVKGVGGANSATQDISNFQASLKDLTQSIQKSAIAATNFVANMQKIEAQISASIKAGLNPGMSKTANTTQQNLPYGWKKRSSDDTSSGFNPKTTEKFTKSIGTLADAIDKLTSGIKENFKAKEKPVEEPEKKSNVVKDVKNLLAAVGIGSLVKQVAENEFVNPARTAGMLISSNVVSNPGQLGSQLLSSYGERVASNTGNILGLAAASTALIPGVGLPLAGLLTLAGKTTGDIIGQTETAPETAIKQRAIGLDYYSNLAKQLPGYGQFAQSQYGPNGFMSDTAVKDPYFESKAVLGKSFFRFAGGSLNESTTTGILKSLTAQGASSPQELSLTGNLLGQIARFTGKTSIDIEKVYKSVEKSGLGPNEGLQKALSLLQSGLTIKQTTDILQNSSQRTEAFSAGQVSYLSSTPFQQFSAQLAGHVTGIDQEKFFNGTAAEKAQEAAKVRKIVQGANKELRSGRLGNNSFTLQELEMWQHITPGMADKVLNVPQRPGNDFINPGKLQAGVIQNAQDATNEAAKNRSSQKLVEDSLDSIAKSIKSMGSLTDATDNLVTAFHKAALSLEPKIVRGPVYPHGPHARNH